MSPLHATRPEQTRGVLATGVPQLVPVHAGVYDVRVTIPEAGLVWHTEAWSGQGTGAAVCPQTPAPEQVAVYVVRVAGVPPHVVSDAGHGVSDGVPGLAQAVPAVLQAAAYVRRAGRPPTVAQTGAPAGQADAVLACREQPLPLQVGVYVVSRPALQLGLPGRHAVVDSV